MKTFLATVFAILLFGAGVLLAPRLQPWLADLNEAVFASTNPTVPSPEKKRCCRAQAGQIPPSDEPDHLFRHARQG
ncbi:MAG: hypothetical protein R3F44_08215 [Candidatus Competibacteraceae bacterium]